MLAGSHNDTGYVLNTLFGLEREWNRYGTVGTAFDRLERRGLERNSGT